VYLPGATQGQAQTDAFVPLLLDRLRALPGVVAAGAGGMAPFGRRTMATGLRVSFAGREPITARSRVYVVTPGYAEALRLRLRAGRLFSEGDRSSGMQSLLVNEEFVRTFLQGATPVGLIIDPILTRGVPAEIVGVVGNVLKEGLRAAAQPEVYVVPAHKYGLRSEIHLLVRTTGDPVALTGAVRDIVRDLRADAAIDNLTTLAAQVSESVGTERSATTTLRGLALMAMLLASVGLYGVLSHLVSTREREIGVRTALGASRLQIAWIVVGDGMATTLMGLTIGLVVAASVTRLMTSLLYGIDPLDPVSFVTAAAGVSAVSLLACALAARRAAKVDPLVALRTE
jgi:putative ABC transport system permease protein